MQHTISFTNHSFLVRASLAIFLLSLLLKGNSAVCEMAKNIIIFLAARGIFLGECKLDFQRYYIPAALSQAFDYKQNSFHAEKNYSSQIRENLVLNSHQKWMVSFKIIFRRALT